MATTDWRCKQCNAPLPPTMVQQGGCHLECFEIWWNYEMDVWKIEHEGSSYIEAKPLAVADMAADSDTGTVYTITKQKMKRGEYEALPEFKGF